MAKELKMVEAREMAVKAAVAEGEVAAARPAHR